MQNNDKCYPTEKLHAKVVKIYLFHENMISLFGPTPICCYKLTAFTIKVFSLEKNIPKIKKYKN